MSKSLVAALVGVVLSGGYAMADGANNVPISAEAECRKVDSRGCTAWPIKDYTPAAGRVFVVPTSTVGMTKSERCKVARLHINWQGKALLATPFGNIEVASKATVIGECQSGSGFGGINAVSKMAWSGTLVEVAK